MADHSDVLRGIQRTPHVQYPVLTPNMQGFQDAVSLNYHFNILTCALHGYSYDSINVANPFIVFTGTTLFLIK